MQIDVVSPWASYILRAAQAYQARSALGGVWMSENHHGSLPAAKYHRAWPFHAAMTPFYRLGSQIQIERMHYRLLWLWQRWIRRQKLEKADVVHAWLGYGAEAFDHADRMGALKVIDCPNSHATSCYGYWQRECDLWCPGEEVPIPRWMWARWNRDVARADMVLCPSVFVRDTMVANGVPSTKCFVNPFGVDTKVFTPREEPPAKPRFIAVGTICVRKGYPYLFRAFERLRARLPEAELICVGEYKADFRMERKKWEGTFTHYPSLKHADLSQLLRNCSAFVTATVEEGFARVVIEAMAAGLPVIATYESGATTLMTDGVEGFITPACDPEALAEKMGMIVADSARNREMGRAAHATAATANTWQDYGNRLLAEFARRRASAGAQAG